MPLVLPLAGLRGRGPCNLWRVVELIQKTKLAGCLQDIIACCGLRGTTTSLRQWVDSPYAHGSETSLPIDRRTKPQPWAVVLTNIRHNDVTLEQTFSESVFGFRPALPPMSGMGDQDAAMQIAGELKATATKAGILEFQRRLLCPAGQL